MGEVISITSRSDVLVTRSERAKLPPDIKVSIDTWRLGGCWQPIPGDYLEFHFHLAAEELDRIAAQYRLEVVNDPRYTSDDYVRAFIVEVRTWRRNHLSLQWDDTRQCFMRRVPVGPHITYEPLRERDLA